MSDVEKRRDAAARSAVKPLPAYLTARYVAWRSGRDPEECAWLAQLAADGQHPRCMVIACCDSRVNVSALFSAEPGDLFILRNVANLVPPYAEEPLHHGASAAIEYAVAVLKVAHIVVLGHARCGGVAAFGAYRAGAADDALASSAFLRSWTDLLAPAYARARACAPAQESPEAFQRRVEQEGVRASIDNLRSFPPVAEAERAGRLTLHGAWLDIADGALLALDGDDGRFVPVGAATTGP